ncbi:MAG TPA: glucokinase [Pyrinomonadaceae bacterium]|nr:glucokinase [Pyrinomonadaceae bacterium]
MILAGDIGGTKTNVALFEGEELGKPLAQRSFPSGKHDSLESIISEFVAEHQPQLTHACFGIAGPVKDGQVKTPNLKWVVNGQALAETLNLERVGLINDLEATAYGIEVLGASQLHALNEGKAEHGGHRALIAAGTGLGMAGLFYDGKHYRPIASEGGHIDYAPRAAIEHELLNYMRAKIGGRVSYERVLSGPGLFNIYSFLRDHKYGEEPDWLAAQIKAGDGSAAVSQAGLAGKSALAVKALDLFADIYGAMAGNLALILKATGGLYVGGGIAPKLIEKLKDGTFMRAFTDKGRMSALVSNIPVRVILDDKTALYGAARCAVENA